MKIADYLKTLVGNDKFDELEPRSELFDFWKSLVGKLAAHTKVFDLQKGTLTIDADHPGWMQLVQLRENEFLSRIQKKFPSLEVRRFRFRLVENLMAPPKDYVVPEPEMAPTLPIEPYNGTLNQEDPVLMEMMKLLEVDSSQKE